MIEHYFKNDECGNRTSDLFNQWYADRHVSGKIIRELVVKFGETGFVENKKRRTENPVFNAPVKITVSLKVAMDTTVSIRQLAVTTGVNSTNLQRVLKKHKSYMYKIQLLQELNKDDIARRLQFYKIIIERTINNAKFSFNVCFSD
ncbi:hypothetical protein ABEB36_015194 [Hypothenemus hampei]|uniref:DUF4817 domain-containing protein n=1 Tax=Hypothenemus hampei TaxID=57062 RepID=A0ABD1E3E8_HYPHA